MKEDLENCVDGSRQNNGALSSTAATSLGDAMITALVYRTAGGMQPFAALAAALDDEHWHEAWKILIRETRDA